jgi:hypothetical protein
MMSTQILSLILPFLRWSSIPPGMFLRAYSSISIKENMTLKQKPRRYINTIRIAPRTFTRIICLLIPFLSVALLVFYFALGFYYITLPRPPQPSFLILPLTGSERVSSSMSTKESSTSCALCFFGLPRSYETLVLPSIVKNILQPNVKYGCDIFVHYYQVSQETQGRYSSGGIHRIDPTAVLKLEPKFREMEVFRQRHPNNNATNTKKKNSTVVVSFVKDTNESFWKSRGDTIWKYRYTKGTDGKLLYFPWKKKSYVYPTSLDNIIKQWHSIQSVWEEMDRMAMQLGKHYTRVAMFRNDVVYVTPIDIYDGVTDAKTTDQKFKKSVVIPHFANWPVNDRLIYGPHDAVKVWATERFSRVEIYASTSKGGLVMHSETFLKDAILSVIQEKGFPVETNSNICFFRARSDGSAMVSDCDVDNPKFERVPLKRKLEWVEQVAAVKCDNVTITKGYFKRVYAHCHWP